MKKTICVIGGTQKSTIKSLGEKRGLNILYHDGHVRGGGNKTVFQKMIKRSDCVVVLEGACSHPSMWLMKELCKKYHTPIHFHAGRGVSGALDQAALICS